jgi:tetratricopeptide (TPR) repeat protein
MWRKGWRSQANDYFDKGSYDELIKHCEERKNKCPNDAHIYWWLGRAYREKGEVKKADDLFSKVKEIEPGWEKEFVEPYVSKTNEAPAKNV